MNNKNKTISLLTLTFAVTFAVASVTTPLIYAEAGAVHDYYWKGNPGMCYNTGSLDKLDVSGSTNKGTTIEAEIEKARSMLNDEMNGITINGDSWLNCYGKHIDVASAKLDVAYLGQSTAKYYSNDNTSMAESEMRFNTEYDWSVGSDSCVASEVDPEWIANHEIGHGIGLMEHTHDPINSMMNEICDEKYAALQSVDKTAIDEHYE